MIDPADLDEATDLEGDGGRYAVRLSEAWEIWGPSGGYLAAIALRAAGRCAKIPRPASFYCHFLSSPDFDDVELTVELLKRGRRSESLAVTMTQNEKPVLIALVRTAADAPGYQHQEPDAPEVTPPGESEPYKRTKDGKPIFRFWNNVSCRRPELGPAQAEISPRIREWVRFEPTSCFEDPFIDAARPLILLDTFGWPAAYQKYRGADYVAPNLDTSVWFHQSAAESEWLLVDHECPVAGDGLLGVSGRIWDAGGRLLATGGAQLCCIPRP
ncbi:MAG TPA: thioesterase family protein [Solirubrobacterales bacterium]|nr:thioesterase family protein [Solirubrobacterales bacterium]